MPPKRPLDDVLASEQEAARSPRKRLRRTVLVMMWLERRRARVVTFEQMAQLVRQVEAEMAKWFIFIVILVTRLGSMERLVLDLQDAFQRLVTQQFPAFQRSLMGSIEDTVRSAVRAEMQERQAALFPNGVYEPPRQTSEEFPETGGITRMVKLCFVDAESPKTLYTGRPVQWQNGVNAKVVILENGRQITQGNLSKLQIEVLPVHADFFTERGQADFTKEEFNKQIYTYKGKESVLTTVNLANGEAYLGSFFFTESSYRKKISLAARVKRQDTTVRVQEAITCPFVVKDRRSELNEKSYPPSKEEGVHCLEKISPNGKRFRDLTATNITKVKHLMRHYHRDKSGLQKITDMKKEDWNTMIKHATTSDPGDEIYSYKVPGENTVLFFNDFYDLVGTIKNNEPYVPYSVDDLDQLQQLKLNDWKKSAHKKFEELEKSGTTGSVMQPDYVMSDGVPVHVQPPNEDARSSVETRTCQCFNTAHQEFGQVHPSQQRNESLPTQVFPNNDAGPSTQETLQFQQYPNQQFQQYPNQWTPEFGQQDPYMLQNGTSYHLTQGNIINGQGPFSGQSNNSFHNIAPVYHDNVITDASFAQNNIYSSLRTDAPVPSHTVADGVDHMPVGILREVPPIEYQGWPEQNFQDALDQLILPANYAELANPESQFDCYGYDDGNGGNFHHP